MNLPEISLVVYFKNRIKHLEAYFKPLLIQRNVKYEVIAIDYCSNDKSLEYVQELRKTYSHLRIIKVEGVKGFNLSKARNIGCVNAKASLCMTVDADIHFLSKNTLTTFLEIYKHWDALTNKFYNLKEMTEYYDRGILCYCGGGNMIFHKSLWERAKGFPHFIKNHGMEDTIFRIRAEMVGGKVFNYFNQTIKGIVTTVGPKERDYITKQVIDEDNLGYIPCDSEWEDPDQNTKAIFNRIMMNDRNRFFEANDSLPNYTEI